jgi:two-component system LytT family sensor kinase
VSIKLNEKNQRLIKAILFHIIAWTLLFILNIAFIKNYRIQFDLNYHIITWLIFIGIFYFNYLVLMPMLFFKRSFILYILISLFMLTGLVTVRQGVDKKHFEKVFRTEIQNEHPSPEEFGRRNMPMPPDFKHPPPDYPKPQKMPRPLFSLYGLVLFFLASMLIRFFEKWQQDEKRNREIEKENIATELTFLKQQINPHFLFNALNSIYSMTINTSDQASDTILKLSSILRYMLYETEHPLVNLRDEISVIDDYIELQKLRVPHNVSVYFKVTGHQGNQQIAPLLLMPLIENAFKYGIDNVSEVFIDIQITIENDNLELAVKNRIIRTDHCNGIDSGIGIKNILRRLELLYPDNYHFETEQTNGIFSVILRLKMIP